jgi:cell division septation protein DedD
VTTKSAFCLTLIILAGCTRPPSAAVPLPTPIATAESSLSLLNAVRTQKDLDARLAAYGNEPLNPGTPLQVAFEVAMRRVPPPPLPVDSRATPVSAGTLVASMTPTATPVEQSAATPTPVAAPKPTATPKAGTTPSSTPRSTPTPLHRINKDVLAAYSKEDFTKMMDMYAIRDTDAVKQMVSEGKVVGLRQGALVYLESVDLLAGIAKVRPKGSTITVWIPSAFLD